MPALKSVEEKYGNILFADQRFKKSPETNTITENKVYKKINGFIYDEFGTNLKSKTVQLFDTLLKSKNNKMYEDVLKPNNATYLYRGIGFKINNPSDIKKTVNFFKGFKGLNGKNIKNLFKNYVIEYTYKPIRKIESWTTDKDMAMSYAKGMFDYTDFGIILRASPPKGELLFNTEFTNKLADALHNFHEYEIVRVSKNLLKCKVQMVGDKDFVKSFIYGEEIIK